MSFVSFAFLFLFSVVFACRLTIGRRRTEPIYFAVLLAASCVFYAWHIPAYLTIILVSTLVDFYAAREMHRCHTESAATPDRQDKLDRRRRSLLAISLALNLGMLAVFKYADFALTELSQVLAAIGWNASLPHLSLVLPMGISFYTFQSMSYSIDVFRGRLHPVDSFAKFSLYVSFFPQLVAGPIVRASEFLYQLDRPRRLNLRAFNAGGYLILRGLFLKVVCADNIGRYVDVHWQDAWQPDANSSTLLLAAVLFSLQIFGDFAGYSSIARGIAYWLGFRFPVNFNNPYLATSFSNFWQRWHITLSQWLRDYLYVPLGGNRHGRLRTYVNLMLVMVIGGLWHGASTTFIAWGALHGAALAIERWFGLNRGQERWSVAGRIAWYGVVQLVVLLTWILFRSGSFAEASRVVSGILAFRFHGVGSDALLPVVCSLPIVAAHIAGFLAERSGEKTPATALGTAFSRTSGLRPFVAAAMLVAVVTCYSQSSDFMYFQF